MRQNITTIPAKLTLQQGQLFQTATKRRTAAYARVSTDADQQETSFTAQVLFYTSKIKENPDWELVEVYTDEGISAVNTKRRDGFKKMISDALNGKIDLIVTKSVSRFARNTVDSLTAVRELKSAGVEVYFEKENIWTFDGKGELLITIMSSLAQEESRSISENVSWGKRRSFEAGKVSLPYKRFLGYERGEDGRPQVVESEAKIVRNIFSDFLHGMTPNAIARKLEDHGVPSPAGKQKWSVTTVRSVLQNEKYKGEALLQKTVGVDFLEKSRKKNEGEAPQYHVKESHEAIVRPEVFDLVQEELKKQRSGGKTRSCVHPFSSQIICGECAGTFGSKTWRSTCGGERVKRSVWQCNDKYRVKGKVNCHTPHLTDEQLKHAFVTAFNQVIGNKEGVIAEYEMMLQTLTDTSKLEQKMERLVDQHQECYTLLKNCIDQKSKQGSAPEADQHYRQLTMRYDGVKAKIEEVASEIEARAIKRTKITTFLDDLKTQRELLTEFDEVLWRRTVEQVVVYRESKISVIFKDGREVVVSVLGK